MSSFVVFSKTFGPLLIEVAEGAPLPKPDKYPNGTIAYHKGSWVYSENHLGPRINSTRKFERRWAGLGSMYSGITPEMRTYVLLLGE